MGLKTHLRFKKEGLGPNKTIKGKEFVVTLALNESWSPISFVTLFVDGKKNLNSLNFLESL